MNHDMGASCGASALEPSKHRDETLYCNQLALFHFHEAIYGAGSGASARGRLCP